MILTDGFKKLEKKKENLRVQTTSIFWWEGVSKTEPDPQLLFHSRYLSNFKAAKGRRLKGLQEKHSWDFDNIGVLRNLIVQMNLFTKQK